MGIRDHLIISLVFLASYYKQLNNNIFIKSFAILKFFFNYKLIQIDFREIFV